MKLILSNEEARVLRKAVKRELNHNDFIYRTGTGVIYQLEQLISQRETLESLYAKLSLNE